MQRNAGVSLLEMLVVLTILGILLSLVYPSYANAVLRTRRVEGQVALIDALQQQERYYTQNNTYIPFSSASTDAQEKRFKWYSGTVAELSAYELRAEPCPGHTIAQCVEVRATPGTAKVDVHFKDAECGVLMLDSAGARSASGTSDHCWP